MFSTADNPHTNYRFIDDGGDEPLHGGPIPNIEVAESEFARYEDGLKTRQSTSIKPYISTPIAERMDVVAFRNNLIAAKSGIGIYRLIPISEQILHTRSSLEGDNSIRNASDVASRVLHNYKGRPKSTKENIAARLIGIVGIAHRGYSTLNVESAKKRGKRIGDCMIEVAWKSRIPDPSTGEYVGTVIMNDSIGYHTSFETRTDLRAFRGQSKADMEIYRFAKDNDNGLIAPDEGWKFSKLNQLKAIELKLDTLQKTKSLLTQRASSKNYYDYSDSENEDDGEDK